LNFLADENLDRQIVERLRQDGYTVWYIPEMEPGISDDEVLDLANQEGALLLTSDKDFGELVFRLGV
jgi:predicted nuclease of predicted toxin-antitoxin system